MSADLLHPGHLNIIHQARKLLEENGHDVKLISFDNEFEEKGQFIFCLLSVSS